jgi:transposase-like protein
VGRKEQSVAEIGREIGVTPSLIHRWVKLSEVGSDAAVGANEEVVPVSELRLAQQKIKELECALGRNRPLPADATAQQRTDRESMLAAFSEHLYLPQHAPLAIQVIAGSDGSIWLRDSVALSLWRLVIGGRVARTVTLPAGVAVRQATASRVWAVRTNADGVPRS